MPDPILKVTDLWKNFGGLSAVSDYRLELPLGMVYGLIGPNGAGKTTILESICVLASTKSYRAPRLFDLVTYQHPIGSIQGDTTDADTLKVSASVVSPWIEPMGC